MNRNPSADDALRRGVIHRMVSELASSDPGSADYDRKLAVLADHVAHPPSSEVQQRVLERDQPSANAAYAPTWRARWRKQKSRLAHAGRALLRAMRRVAARDQDHPHRRGPPANDDLTPPYPAGIDAQAVAARSVAGLNGRFTSNRLTDNRFGRQSCRYMLYEPAFRKPGPAPLLVLLHGCFQKVEDFAAGTRMNEAAEDAGVVVLYPEQSLAASLSRCWNWYALQDRSNSKGDAARIAAMTRQVTRKHDIDAARVYVAGMSAGGAMAAVLARDYPELYAALGVHSGVPAGLAHDVISAARLMSSGPAAAEVEAFPASGGGVGHAVPSIVFHGDEDKVVHPSNGQAVHDAPGGARTLPQPLGALQATTEPANGQRGFSRSVELGPGGVTNRELWIVHGAGHAWAGGSDDERHTDASGPDASREMLRFFLQHRLAA